MSAPSSEGSGYRHADDCIYTPQGDPDHAAAHFPFVANGRTFLPARFFEFGTVKTHSGLTLGTLMVALEHSPMGLHVPMTPATMRMLGARLLVEAGKIEAAADDAAMAAIAEARP